MEKDYFNLRDYLDNPGGKGSATGVSLQNTKNHFQDEMKKIEKLMNVVWYKTPKKDKLAAHITLPSQSVDNIKYDIVFEFEVGENRNFGDSVLDCPVKVFSNSPSFVYTYAYAFKKYRRLVSWADEKYPEGTLTTEPKTKNPYKMISFERSIYLAAAYIKNRRDYIPLVAGTGNMIKNISDVKEYVQDMDSLDKARTDFKEVKKQAKKADEEEKKKTIDKTSKEKEKYKSDYQKKHSQTSTPTAASSNIKKAKPSNAKNIKKPTATKKPKKGVR